MVVWLLRRETSKCHCAARVNELLMEQASTTGTLISRAGRTWLMVKTPSFTLAPSSLLCLP